ncbi:hypothetical protein [Citrifermentans bremense]|uniref:hypothetical protein n=1 Tax=Citrifermentans bremense TaxID=60035 RepID=UPI0012EB480E|nr:hypothetical protein [Citrifermentans bremense]
MSNKSVTISSVIVVGLLLTITGAIIAVLGFGGVVAYDYSLAKNTIKTDSIGLAIMSVGALLVIVAISKVDKVRVFGSEGYKSKITKIIDYVIEYAWTIYLLLAVSILLFIGSLV